jgi:hypothetical protein
VIAGGALVLLAAVTSWWTYVPVLAICGFGLGLSSSFASIVTQQVAGPRRAGEASGLGLAARTIAAGIGLAATASIIDVIERSGHATAAACDTTLLIFAFLSLAAPLIATTAGYALWRGTI